MEPWESGTEIHNHVRGAERGERRAEKHSGKQLSRREERLGPWSSVAMLRQNKSYHLACVPTHAPEACLRPRKKEG